MGALPSAFPALGLSSMRPSSGQWPKKMLPQLKQGVVLLVMWLLMANAQTK